MGNIWGDKKMIKQIIREQKRINNRSIRELDRELNKIKREQKKAQNEMKRLAKQGQMQAVKHLAKDIVRMKDSETKCIKLKSELRSLSAQMDNMADTAQLQKAMKNVSRTLGTLSNQIRLPELQAALQKYQIESEQMEMKQDMINDTLDDALDADSDAEDELIQKVLDEVGLDLNEKMVEAPKYSMKKEELYEDACEHSMQRRLAALNGDSSNSYSYSSSNYNSYSRASSNTYSHGTSTYSVRPSSFKSKSATIGLSVGGAKDVNNFRKCIEKNQMPSIGSITYNGLLYEYYFDTKTRKHIGYNDDEKKMNNDGSMLFYPSYCYSKCEKLDFFNSKKKDINNMHEYEYYMTLGLNSNIRMDDFKRKNLNLVIVLDKSGSMGSRFYDDSRSSSSSKTKMEVANESIIGLLKHLTRKDRFGLVTFENDAIIMNKLQFINDINMDELKKSILSIKQSGGTNFECGYSKAIDLYFQLFNDNDYKLNSIHGDYDNRIILLTDARPNVGKTDTNSLLEMVQKYAENKHPINCDENEKEEYIGNRIYTTFIGIGVDFNANLIESISKARGCNYYSVSSTKDFINKMDQEFEYMVTPLVFNVLLKLKCEGNSCQIDKVYGSNDLKSKQIVKSGEISRIDTLFPAKKRPSKNRKCTTTKGGIQLIKLKKTNNDNNINVEIEVSFEDRNGKKYTNQQIVTFEAPKLNKNKNKENDMIENDQYDEKENDFFDNTGIQKAILLCKYVEIMMEWIKNRNNNTSNHNATINVNDKYKKLFTNFMIHFKKQMKECNDDDLQKEIDIMQKLINS